jgi:peptide/nickel transport system permease protein
MTSLAEIKNTQTAATRANVRLAKQPSTARRIWHSLSKSRLAMLGLILVSIILILAVLAPVVTPYDPEHVDIRNRLKPPAWMASGSNDHFLGTDNVGRDILSRLLYGARISLFIGISTVVTGGIVGTLLGILAGYLGGRVDTAVMRVVDIQLAFPSILLAVAIMGVLGPSLRNVIFVLSLASWASFCRIARGQTLSAREKEFIEAARATGVRQIAIVFRHILPNVISPLIVVASFGAAINIINEASLSFLGVGVPPTVPTWGGMLGEGRNYLRLAWWLATFPGIALMLTVFSINVIGDWLRDYLDPRLQTL